MYLLPKITKHLVNVPGRCVTSNCGMPNQKASKFLDYHLQPTMMSAMSYIKDTNACMFLSCHVRVSECIHTL